MVKQFIDTQTRSAYIVGLTEILCQIFEISDVDRKKAIHLELNRLNDETLIERKKYVEEYLERDNQLTNMFQNRVDILEHTIVEQDEKEVLLGKNFNY